GPANNLRYILATGIEGQLWPEKAEGAESSYRCTPRSHQQHIGLIIVPGHAGMAPFVSVLALEPHFAGQFIGDERGRRIALVLTRRADIAMVAPLILSVAISQRRKA